MLRLGGKGTFVKQACCQPDSLGSRRPAGVSWGRRPAWPCRPWGTWGSRSTRCRPSLSASRRRRCLPLHAQEPRSGRRVLFACSACTCVSCAQLRLGRLRKNTRAEVSFGITATRGPKSAAHSIGGHSTRCSAARWAASAGQLQQEHKQAPPGADAAGPGSSSTMSAGGCLQKLWSLYSSLAAGPSARGEACPGSWRSSGGKICTAPLV